MTSRPVYQHIGWLSSGRGSPHTQVVSDGFSPEKLLWEVKVYVYTWLDLKDEIAQELPLFLALGTEEVCVWLLGLHGVWAHGQRYRF